MVTAIMVPKSGMTQENITLLEWLVPEETPVSKGDSVLTLETSKSAVEVESPADGLLFKLRQESEKVDFGDVLGAVADSREEYESFLATLEQPTDPIPSPLEEDTTLVVENHQSSTASQVKTDGGLTVLERIPFAGMRKTIARNLVGSLQSGAQLTVVAEADMTDLALFRKELMLDNPEDKITYVDILVKLVAMVLKEFPIINASIVEDEILCWGNYHIGVAVSLDDGLVVPVVKDADRKSLFSISKEIKKLSRKARQKKLGATDLEGGTFTISSGGKNEVEFMTPIVNPPQSAILGIGKIGPKPGIHDGQIEVRTMTYLCLTHDHRVIDGVVAGDFIGRLKQLIENQALFREVLK